MAAKKEVQLDAFVKDFRTPYAQRPAPVKLVCGEGRTKQSFADECNINRIIAKYRRTGLLDHVSRYQGQYGDVSGADFREALHLVMQAEESFGSLPADLRKRFGNDPAEFLAFVSDERNREEAVKLGLVNPPPAEPKAAEESPGPSGDA